MEMDLIPTIGLIGGTTAIYIRPVRYGRVARVTNMFAMVKAGTTHGLMDMST